MQRSRRQAGLSKAVAPSLSFELFIAVRYLRAKRRQAVVGLVTLISIAGVAAGVAALVVALAITNGMRRDLQDRLLGSSAHVTLLKVKGDGMRDWQPLLARLRQLPHVTAAAPEMYEQVMVSVGPRSGFALLKAVIPAQERTVSDLLDMVVSGSAAELADGKSTLGSVEEALPPLVLGKDLAGSLGASVGDTVLVTSPQGELTPIGGNSQLSEVPRRWNLPFRFLCLRLWYGFSQADRCTTPFQRTGCYYGDQLQGG